MKYLPGLVLFFVCFTFIYAQDGIADFDNLHKRYGLFGNYNYNLHIADFRNLPGIPNCCPRFGSGSGSGFSVGLLFEMPVYHSLMFNFRTGYYIYDAILIKNEETTIIRDNSYNTGIFEHYLKAGISSVGFQPEIGYNIFGGLFISAGINFGIVINRNYKQKETLLGSGTFIDTLGYDTKMAVRNENSGQIPNSFKSVLSITGRINYDLPLNNDKTWLFSPEITYSYDVIPIVANYKWNFMSFQAGLALKYSPESGIEKPINRKEVEEIDTVKLTADNITSEKYIIGVPFSKTETAENEVSYEVIETYRRTDTLISPARFNLSANIKAVGLDSAGHEMENPVFTVNVNTSARLQPLLNYVFFSQSSEEPDQRYTRLSPADAERFNENLLFHQSVLNSYNNILNIIGSRLRRYPLANLTITSCTDGSQIENENKSLSSRRAENIKRYLKEVWNIEDKRIVTEARNLPQNPSTPLNDPEKAEENRRVEFSSDNNEILKPLLLSDTIVFNNDPIIRFNMNIIASAGFSEGAIHVLQNNKAILSLPVQDQETQFLDWKPKTDITRNIDLSEPLYYYITIKDKKNQIFTSDQKLLHLNLVRKMSSTSDSISVNKYSLVLFDFDRSEIEGANKKILDIIRERIKPGAKVKITGYTDRTGDEKYNLRLSQRRAEVAKSTLGYSNSVASGVGKSTLLFDNNLPEGRFYSRTVDIVIEMPENIISK